MQQPKIAIIGAGPAGLMAAEVLSRTNCLVHVYEQKPSAARKFLMAGKTGLNISHAEPIDQFVRRYDQVEWLDAWVRRWDAKWIQQWMEDLGVESYVGSSGRIFPVEMKAAPLLRAWLKRLSQDGVKFFYRHQVLNLNTNQTTVEIQDHKNDQVFTEKFDAVVLACGAVSWPELGSDGAWQKWLNTTQLEPFQASNAGVLKTWSAYMNAVFGEPLKRVQAWVDGTSKASGDIVITHYGLESGLIYKFGRALRGQLKQSRPMHLHLDLLPDVSESQLIEKLSQNKKQSMVNVWRKAGLDAVKANLVREVVEKSLWSQPQALASRIKNLVLDLEGFRPIDEAISCAGGIKQAAVTADLQLDNAPAIFCCGEMLDWDAPTGGYLLTACFATGRAAGEGVLKYLQQVN